MKRWFTLGLIMIMALSLFAERKALVIANSNYDRVTLNSPINDATNMESALTGLGFSVSRYNNLRLAAMVSAVDSFATTITANDDVVVYFAGHGTAYDGVNYLCPAGMNLSTSQSYKKTAYNLNTLAAKTKIARTSMLVIEASKQWTPDGTKAIAKPFAKMLATAPTKQVIVFSARPDKIVLNSYEEKSIFTTTFIKNITESDLNFNLMMQGVITEVATQTKGLQVPWVSGVMTTEFIFNPLDSKWRFKSFDLWDTEGGGSISW
ncbi:MAG TPA: caspase family protein [Candidatus Cloacimonadota bacterium]|nr:caspase family protein [Candidatus Cloacimonadota bacterium]HPS37835.1 caspase family protein [Candidatus Cloacimonadota bacterium]